MTLKEYYKLNIATFKYCLKICGVIFTSIAAIISIALSFKENSTDHPLIVFAYCVVFGNLLGIFIAFLGFLAGYREMKKIFRIFSSISHDLKDSLSLSLQVVQDDYRFNFLNYKITTIDNPFFRIEYNTHKNEVWIYILLNFSDLDNLIELMENFNRKYKKEKIQLTGFGIVKRIRYNKFEEKDISRSIQELLDIVKQENFELRK